MHRTWRLDVKDALREGENVIRGARLNINVATNQAKMEGGRVQMLIAPKSLQNNNN